MIVRMLSHPTIKSLFSCVGGLLFLTSISLSMEPNAALIINDPQRKLMHGEEIARQFENEKIPIQCQCEKLDTAISIDHELYLSKSL